MAFINTTLSKGRLVRISYRSPSPFTTPPNEIVKKGIFAFCIIVRDMKTLLKPKDKEEIITRLQTVRSNSQRLWGEMSAHQMVCHLGDGFRMYLGLKPVPPLHVPYPRTLLKWVALWAPIPWPKGFKTAPELDQQVSGTPPAAFDHDMGELRNLVDRFTRRPRNLQWQPHPHFGQMSDREWMRLAYLHVDHHLRQFGA